MWLPHDVGGIGLDDLEGLVRVAAQEDVHLELKSIDVRKERLERSVCAFANTAGGHIVIGASADPATNRITGLPGVPAEPNLLERWMQWLNDIRPRVDTRHSPLIDAAPGKVACVLYQPFSPLAPHMASDHRYWLRAGPKNQEMPEEMVHRYYLARQVADRAAHDLLDSLAWGSEPSDAPLLTVLLCPMQLTNDTVPMTMEMKRTLSERLQAITQVPPGDIVLYEAAIDLHPSYRGLRGNASAQRDADAFIEIRPNGLTRITESLPVVPPGAQFDTAPRIRLEPVAMTIPRFLKAMATVLNAIQYHGVVTLVCTLTQTQGKALASDDITQRLMLPPPCSEPVLTFSREVTAGDLDSAYADLCRWFVLRLVQAFDYRVFEATNPAMEEAIRRHAAITF